MSYSANEYQALCRKAARGAGLPWGYAEDAGFAARYLAEFGLDDGVSFSLLLDQFSPESVLIKALTLCDLERDFEAEIILDEIENPLFFLPFLTLALGGSKITLHVSWDGAEFVLDADHLWCAAYSKQDRAPQQRVVIKQCEALEIPAERKQFRLNIDALVMQRLQAFAHVTYAPATEESRAAGAGAGLNDND